MFKNVSLFKNCVLIELIYFISINVNVLLSVVSSNASNFYIFSNLYLYYLFLVTYLFLTYLLSIFNTLSIFSNFYILIFLSLIKRIRAITSTKSFCREAYKALQEISFCISVHDGGF